MKLTTRRVVLIATIAALYAIFTIILAPVSYGPLQFRVSEALKVLCLVDPFFAIGIGIGTIFANMASPFVGPWELIWMPLTDILGGLFAYFFFDLVLNKKKRWFWIPLFFYGGTTGLSVGLMLKFMGMGYFVLPLAGPVIVSEIIILIVGYPILLPLFSYLEKK